MSMSACLPAYLSLSLSVCLSVYHLLKGTPKQKSLILDMGTLSSVYFFIVPPYANFVAVAELLGSTKFCPSSPFTVSVLKWLLFFISLFKETSTVFQTPLCF